MSDFRTGLFDLTTQVPHQVWIALPRSSQRPRLAYPPLEVVWLPPGPYQAGMEERTLLNLGAEVLATMPSI